MNYTRRFKLGKLYYKYIKGTPLETQGWRSQDVATLLVDHGFIRLVTTQKQGLDGRFSKGSTEYVELEGKSIGRIQFFKIFKESLRAYGDSGVTRASALSLREGGEK